MTNLGSLLRYLYAPFTYPLINFLNNSKHVYHELILVKIIKKLLRLSTKICSKFYKQHFFNLSYIVSYYFVDLEDNYVNSV